MDSAVGVGVRRDGPSIGMHIRRGDSCGWWALDASALEGEDPGRMCYSLVEYIAAARKLRDLYGAHHVVVATDSESVISDLAEYADEFSFEYLDINRTLVGGVEGANMNLAGADRIANFIEFRENFDDAQREAIFPSFLADVELLLRADMFVGTALATLSRLALFALIGAHATIPPFIFLDSPLHSHHASTWRVSTPCGSCPPIALHTRPFHPSGECDSVSDESRLVRGTSHLHNFTR